MSLVFRNALMPSENQQVLRLRLVYLMRRYVILYVLIFGFVPFIYEKYFQGRRNEISTDLGPHSIYMGNYRACMAGAKKSWELQNPSMPLPSSVKAANERLCKCIEDGTKNLNRSQFEATDWCLFIRGEQKNLIKELKKPNPIELEKMIEVTAEVLMTNDKRYNKTSATKVTRCVLTSVLQDGLTEDQMERKCKHLFYPNTRFLK